MLSDPVAAALNRIADELKRYNDRNEPKAHIAGEAEYFRATYDRETDEQRELKDYLRGVEAKNIIRRPQAQQDGGSKKASRRGPGGAK
jgi:hypothetical protein